MLFGPTRRSRSSTLALAAALYTTLTAHGALLRAATSPVVRSTCCVACFA
jgi:hypothetical protein